MTTYKARLPATSPPTDSVFAEIVILIERARQRALQAVNTTLIDLYWQVGGIISRKIAAAEWGDGVVDKLASHIAREQPNLRGFTRRNLFRMRQFYEVYGDQALVTPLATQLPWTHHLIILSQSKRPEEREFYLRMAVQERWSKRELERQLKTALFERVLLSPAKVSAVTRQTHPEALNVFNEGYKVEFMGRPITENRLTARRESGRLGSNNARQGYVDLRIDTLKLAGYLFGRSA